MPTRRFHRNDLVEVLSEREIRATLDSAGNLAGLPFMPEMVKHCGGRFRVRRRVTRVYHDHFHYVGRLEGCVILEGLRCDGQAHAGCQMGCMLLWRDEWLKPAASLEGGASGGGAAPLGTSLQLPILQGDRITCQATELIHATTRLPWWDVRQYAGDLFHREMPLRRFLWMIWLLIYSKIGRRLRLAPYGEVRGSLAKTPDERLDLQPGELVEVRGLEEVRATLDEQSRNRGLAFGGDMARYCGRRFRVARRVEKIVLEWTGEARRVGGTVALEDVTCDGMDRRGCPRNCYHLWREVWLKRVEDAAPLPQSSERGKSEG